MENNDTGLLLNKKNIEIHRQFFSQFVRLLGINVQFRAPRENSKGYNNYGELDTFYYEPVTVGCIYDEHPNQKSMRKLGWNTELADTSTVIHVPYDLDKIQTGALFIIPSGLDNAEPRIFKVLRMSNLAIYPCSIMCELGPVWNNNMESNKVELFENSNFNVLASPEEDS